MRPAERWLYSLERGVDVSCPEQRKNKASSLECDEVAYQPAATLGLAGAPCSSVDVGYILVQMF